MLNFLEHTVYQFQLGESSMIQRSDQELQDKYNYYWNLGWDTITSCNDEHILHRCSQAMDIIDKELLSRELQPEIYT